MIWTAAENVAWERVELDVALVVALTEVSVTLVMGTAEKPNWAAVVPGWAVSVPSTTEHVAPV